MADRFKIVIAVYVLLMRDGKVLLMRRAGTGYRDGQYGVPAGHLEANESVAAAAIREAKEETGVTIAPSDLHAAHFIHKMEQEADRTDNRLNLFFKAEKWSGEPKNMEPNKCDDLSWFPVNALPENTIYYVRHAIEQTAKGNTYSELGWTNI